MENKESFFKDFFLNLEKKRIPYTILRNDNFIHNKEYLGEIDLLIERKNLKKLKKIIDKNPFCHRTKKTIDLTHPLMVLVKGEDFICFLDFQVGGVGYCGAPILRESFLLEDSKREKSFFVLNDSAYLLMLFIHNFIFKRERTYFNKYKKEFYNIFEKTNKEELIKELTKIFNHKISTEIIDLFSKKKLNEIGDMKRKLILMHLLKKPLHVFRIIYSKGIRFLNYFDLWSFFYFLNIFKYAPLVSFVGTDGSGKSTFGKRLKKELDLMEIDNKIISASAFSSIKLIKRKKREYSTKIGSLEKKDTKSIMEIIARILLQMPKQLKIIYLRKKGVFVITDRYPYDLITLFGVKGFWRKVVKISFQEPTKIFYIHANPKSIYGRNKELNMKFIKKVQNSFKENIDFLSLKPIKNENLSIATKEILSKNWEIIKNEK